ncbi:AMP-binding protein [Embleya sp. NPDC005575]|uniref:AMP-binding protein n=1 Tax=Embleya sp. NPDC005575 TaxID=3156892 RepID=UPI0033A387C4
MDTLARELRARGVREGDRIALIFAGREWADYAVAYCAVHRAGAVAVPLPKRLPPAALHTMLAHCAATAVLHGADIRPAPTDAWSSPAADSVRRGPGRGRPYARRASTRPGSARAAPPHSNRPPDGDSWRTRDTSCTRSRSAPTRAGRWC